ncbi:MAG TPA: four helix bundle protein [Blastocatellia bacterium]|nr:four helix bundle protein [Blastocatellia bacterium]
MEVYRLSLFAGDLAWEDATKLMRDRRTRRLSDQLYRAVGSVSSNISEGYSRSTGRDRALFYSYALGSGREGRDWYYKGRHVLGESVTSHRLDLMTQIIRMLLVNSRPARSIVKGREALYGDLQPSDSTM